MRIWLLIIFVLFINSCNAQGQSDSLWQNYQEHFKNEYLNFGALLQFVFDYQSERTQPGNNGFSVANMRLKLQGKMDGGFGYFIQTKFDNSPAILDAFLTWQYSSLLRLQMGQFKAPFGKEFLIPAPNTDFVNRSRMVAALVPGRQIGFKVRGVLANATDLVYQLGFFNGNNVRQNSNDDDRFMYMGRLSLYPLNRSETRLQIGANAVFSKDEYVRLGKALHPVEHQFVSFRGERTLWGADFRLVMGKYLLAGEYISGDFEGSLLNGPEETLRPFGYHLTAGYMIKPDLQILGRLDRFDVDHDRLASEQVWIGLNYWPTKVTELQFNYIINANRDKEQNQMLLSAQLAL